MDGVMMIFSHEYWRSRAAAILAANDLTPTQQARAAQILDRVQRLAFQA